MGAQPPLWKSEGFDFDKKWPISTAPPLPTAERVTFKEEIVVIFYKVKYLIFLIRYLVLS